MLNKLKEITSAEFVTNIYRFLFNDEKNSRYRNFLRKPKNPHELKSLRGDLASDMIELFKSSLEYKDIINFGNTFVYLFTSLFSVDMSLLKVIFNDDENTINIKKKHMLKLFTYVIEYIFKKQKKVEVSKVQSFIDNYFCYFRLELQHYDVIYFNPDEIEEFTKKYIYGIWNLKFQLDKDGDKTKSKSLYNGILENVKKSYNYEINLLCNIANLDKPENLSNEYAKNFSSDYLISLKKNLNWKCTLFQAIYRSAVNPSYRIEEVICCLDNANACKQFLIKHFETVNSVMDEMDKKIDGIENKRILDHIQRKRITVNDYFYFEILYDVRQKIANDIVYVSFLSKFKNTISVHNRIQTWSKIENYIW